MNNDVITKSKIKNFSKKTIRITIFASMFYNPAFVEEKVLTTSVGEVAQITIFAMSMKN